MDSQVFGCPKCNQPFQVLAQQAGHVVQCPACAQPIEIPADAFAKTGPARLHTETQPAEPIEPSAVGPSQVLTCDDCGGQFGLTEEMVGLQVACPHCQRIQNTDAPDEGPPQIDIQSREAKSIEDSRPAADARPSPTEDELFAPGHQIASPRSKKPDDPASSRKRTEKRKRSPDAKPNRRPDRTNSGTKSRPPVGKSSDPVDQPKTATRSSAADLPIEAAQTASKTLPPTTEFRAVPDPLLPPEADTSPSHLGSGVTNESVPAAATKSEISNQESAESGTNLNPIDHLLPPRFDVIDPTRLKFSETDDCKVLLPDGAGGNQPFDQRILRVEHQGEKVSLVALTPKQRMRRRVISNLVAILIGIIIIAIAFTVLSGD